MDNLETLNALLDMTKEAEELASDVEKSERLRSLFVEIRSKAKEERTRLKRGVSRYELCMIGILEELACVALEDAEVVSSEVSKV